MLYLTSLKLIANLFLNFIYYFDLLYSTNGLLKSTFDDVNFGYIDDDVVVIAFDGGIDDDYYYTSCDYFNDVIINDS